MTTVAEAFQQLNILPWWSAGRVTQSFGENGEKGTDFALAGFGSPVGSLTGGQVVYVGDGGYAGSSIGQIVQVLTPDGRLLHYQHLKDSNVVMGQTVSPGDIVGTEGGCPVGAYPLAGGSCKWTDQYSTGAHIEVRESNSYNPNAGVWNQAWNPNNLAVFQQLAAGTAQAAPAPSLGIPNPFGNINLGQIGIKIGAFVLGLALVLIGMYVLFQHQIEGVGGAE